jgi:hypothetical protein
VRLLAVGALAILLTGCIKLNMDLVVSSDNKVGGTIIFAMNKQLVDLAGGSIDDIMSQDSPVPAGMNVKTEDYEDDTFVGKKYTFDGVALEKFNSSDLSITREDTGGTAGMPGAAEMMQGADVRVSMTFPGPVESASGQIDGNTVTWTPKVGDKVELKAVASAIDSGGGSSMILIIGAAVLVIVIIVLVVVLAKRGKRGQPALAGADAGAAGGYPGTGAEVPAVPTAPSTPAAEMPPPPPPPPSSEPPATS